MASFIDPTAKIGDIVSIDISTRGTNTYIGKYCVIDDFVKIKHVGGDKDIRIGDYCYLNSGCVLYSGHGITIGNHVLIGPNCNLVPSNHNFQDRDTIIRLQGHQPSRGGIVIEDDVWLGANVTVLDGAHLSEGCVIGANSLIIGKTEPYSVYAGVPAKKIKNR